MIVLLSGILALVGLLLVQTLRAHRQLARRTRVLADAARRLAAGELHISLPVRGDDDLSSLAASFNQLAEAAREGHLDRAPDRVFDQAMVRETPNGLLIVDGRGLVRRFNPALERLLPVDGNPIGRAPVETIPVAELQAVLEEVSRTRQVSERAGVVGKRELLFRGLPLADGEGSMGVVLDITSVRDAERARRDFVANVSHELRTPITAIVGFSEALLDEAVSDDVRPMVEAIDRNARRLHALIADVLQLSKIEARRDDFPLEVEALLPLVEQVADRLAPLAQARGLRLLVDIPPALTARVNVDALEHAVSNLVDNAIKYTPSGGTVSVTAIPADQAVLLTVRDTGIGIDPMHHARIFERFYRVDAGRSRDAGGTGLGLALVKHLCLAMEAEISFESVPGQGSAFTLKLPT